MKRLFIVLILLLLPSFAFAQVVARVPARSNVLPDSTVANLPTSPPDGTLVRVTDGTSTSDCEIGGNPGTFALCFYDFDSDKWLPADSSSSSGSLQNAFALGKAITGATSEADCFRVGSTTTYWCIYFDGSDLILGTSSASDWTIPITANQDFVIHDKEAAKDAFIFDPDSIGAGSGTATYQTSYQIVASNLGLEFTESDTNAACAGDNFNIYADLSEQTLKKCIDGTATDLDRILVIERATDLSITSDDTLTIDSVMQFIPEDSEHWLVIYHLYMGATTDDAGDVKFGWTLPTGMTGAYTVQGFASSITDCSAANSFISGSIEAVGTDTGSFGLDSGFDCYIKITANVTNGTPDPDTVFGLEWAQGTSSASATIMRKESFMIATRLGP